MIHGKDEPTISISSPDPGSIDHVDLGPADGEPYALLWVHEGWADASGIFLGPVELRALARKALSLADELEASA